MPRVHHVKAARKDNPAVKAGQPYYYWTFRYGGKRYSATYPKQSQLCQGKNSSFYAAIEAVEDGCKDATSIEELEAIRDEAVSNLEEVRDEYQEGFDNLPENFQYAETGERIQEAIDSIEELMSELENWDAEEFEEEEYDEEPNRADYEDVDDYRADYEEWEDGQEAHANEQEDGKQAHFEEQASNLEETATNHCFPY